MNTSIKTRRNILKPLAVLALLPFTACTTGAKMKKTITLDMAIRNYVRRSLFDIDLNGRSIGGVRAFGTEGGHTHGGEGGVHADFTFDLDGPQILTWRDAGTGVKTTAKNPLYIREEDMPKGVRYLCIHIYPNETAEFTFSVHDPMRTQRGMTLVEEQSK
jgi:hypothetical protein